MEFKDFYLTIHERIAIQVILLYQERVVGSGLDETVISSDKKLKKLIVSAVDWYRKTDSFAIDSSPKYEYIKREYELYLDRVSSDAFLNSISEEFRRFLRMYYCR